MARLFVIIKRKGSKRYSAAVPVKSGRSKASVKKSISKSIKPGFTYKIVTLDQLKKIVLMQRPKGRSITKRKKRVRRTRRAKTTKKRRIKRSRRKRK